MNALVLVALKRTLELRDKLADLKTGTTTILNHQFTSNNLWGNYHRAIICGLNNEPEKSEHFFDLILNINHDVAWADELKNSVSELKTELNSITNFQNCVDKIIEKTRSAKKLKAIAIKNVW
jgi:hypothetical protein